MRDQFGLVYLSDFLKLNSIKKAEINSAFVVYLFLPNIKDTINNTKNIKNSIFEIPAAVPAIPPKPSMAAMIAIIRNIIEYFNIVYLPCFYSSYILYPQHIHDLNK